MGAQFFATNRSEDIGKRFFTINIAEMLLEILANLLRSAHRQIFLLTLQSFQFAVQPFAANLDIDIAFIGL